MWTPEVIAAIAAAAVAIIGAVGTAIAQMRHSNDPNAHGSSTPPSAHP